MFSIFESVFLSSRNIAILGCVWCISRSNHANRKIKTSENSRGLKRRYRGRNLVHRSQDILYGSKHLKEWKNKDLCIETHSQASRAWSMRPEHAFSTHSGILSIACAPRALLNAG